MPYKKRNNRLAYDKGYYAGYRKATIDHLENKCVICGKNDNLEIHHKKFLNRKPRSLKDISDLTQIELRCKEHHDS